MKRLIWSLGFMTFAGSALALDTQMPPEALDMECPKCHAIDHTVVGPAWIEVSKRYRDTRDDPKKFDELVKKVSKGGTGNWGHLQMVANDPAGKRRDKIERVVKFILALSDQLPENQAKQGK